MAQIYLSSLDDRPTPKAIRNALKDLQKQSPGWGENKKLQILAHAYEQAMERISGQKLGLKELAMQVLSWITYAKRPLTPSELQHALAVEPDAYRLDKDNMPQVEDMVSVCVGLVTIDRESGIIRLAHYTVQEYFERTQEEWFPNAEAEITRICVTYLSFDVFASGYCGTDDEFKKRLQQYPLYHYTAHNWGHHARKARIRSQVIMAFLKSEVKVQASGQAMAITSIPIGGPEHMTGVHLAAYFGLVEAICILLEDGHSPSLKDAHGQTPLLLAAQNGFDNVICVLLKSGAGTDIRDNWGQTPLLLAARNGHDKVIDLLLKSGAGTEITDKWGQTPLSCAAENGHEAAVRLLLEQGAELESEDSIFRSTPILWAAWKGHDSVVKLLLENGAAVEPTNKYGSTPLSLAAEHRQEAVVKLLLDTDKANVFSKDENGQTPLLLAIENGNEAIVKLLREKAVEAEVTECRTTLSCVAENEQETGKGDIILTRRYRSKKKRFIYIWLCVRTPALYLGYLLTYQSVPL